MAQVVVSIHAPAQGATVEYEHTEHGIVFQSTPPRRGRRGMAAAQGGAHPVSIHAPAQGAT